MADHDNLRCTLDLAKTCVHTGQGPRALEHLRSVQSAIDDLPDTSLAAEFELIYAGALAGMNDRSAEMAFEDALKVIAELSEPDLTLAMTAHGEYAKYLAGRRVTINRARQHYQQAERIADSLGLNEHIAHFQMCAIRIQLEQTGDLDRLRAFQKLQEAAKDTYTEVQQREAWINYIAEIEDTRKRLIAARKGGEATVEYFRGALSHIRRHCA
jgi:hypothetical protein